MTDTSPSTMTSHRWTITVAGARLRHVRRQHGLSQDQLAAKAGISRATVARLERHPSASCRSRTLARLAAALGEDPAGLIPARQP
ncbi:MAG: helix-turn-helix domain-containing protein [Streptosporangiaceae bacterium]